ncbi:MAG: hypothetical protein AB8U44_03720 [Aaplasma endosymbiont of Hyalomma asiaticum]
MLRSVSSDQNNPQADDVVGRSISRSAFSSDRSSSTEEKNEADVFELLSLRLSIKKHQSVFNETLRSLSQNVSKEDLPNADFLTEAGYANLKRVLCNLSRIASRPSLRVTATELIETMISVDREDNPINEEDAYPARWGSKTRDLFILWLRLKKVDVNSHRDEYASAMHVLQYFGIKKESLPNSGTVTSDVLVNLEKVWIALERFYHPCRSSLVDAIEKDLLEHGFIGQSVKDFAKFVSTSSGDRSALAYKSYAYDGTMKSQDEDLTHASGINSAELPMQPENLIHYVGCGSPTLGAEAPSDYGMEKSAEQESTPSSESTRSVAECEEVTANSSLKTSHKMLDVSVQPYQLGENPDFCSSFPEGANQHNAGEESTVAHQSNAARETLGKISSSRSLDGAANRELESFLSSSTKTVCHRNSSATHTPVDNNNTGSKISDSAYYSFATPSAPYKHVEQKDGSHFRTCEDMTKKDGECTRFSASDEKHDTQHASYASGPPLGVHADIGRKENATQQAAESRGYAENRPCTFKKNSLDCISSDISNPATNKKSDGREALGSGRLRNERCDTHAHNAEKIVEKHAVAHAPEAQNGADNYEVESYQKKQCQTVSHLVCDSIGTQEGGFDYGVSPEHRQSCMSDSRGNSNLLNQGSPMQDTEGGRKVLINRNKKSRSLFSWKKELSVVVALFCAVFLFVLAIVTSVGVSTPFLSPFLTSPTSLVVTYAFLLGISGMCLAVALLCSDSVAWGWAERHTMSGESVSDTQPQQIVSNPGGITVSVCMKDAGKNSEQRPEAVDAVLRGDVARHHSDNSYVCLDSDDLTSSLNDGISVTDARADIKEEEPLMLMPVPCVTRL